MSTLSSLAYQCENCWHSRASCREGDSGVQGWPWIWSCREAAEESLSLCPGRSGCWAVGMKRLITAGETQSLTPISSVTPWHTEHPSWPSSHPTQPPLQAEAMGIPPCPVSATSPKCSKSQTCYCIYQMLISKSLVLIRKFVSTYVYPGWWTFGSPPMFGC